MTAVGDISSSLEDYLEAILQISQKHQVARVKDIANMMGVSKSSVTNALKNLSAQEFVNYDPYSYVTLTSKGEELAKRVFQRHRVLTRFIHLFLELDEKTAEENACRIEHIIDKEVFDRLMDIVNYMELHPDEGKAMRDKMLHIKGK